ATISLVPSIPFWRDVLMRSSLRRIRSRFVVDTCSLISTLHRRGCLIEQHWTTVIPQRAIQAAGYRAPKAHTQCQFLRDPFANSEIAFPLERLPPDPCLRSYS